MLPGIIEIDDLTRNIIITTVDFLLLVVLSIILLNVLRNTDAGVDSLLWFNELLYLGSIW